MYSLLDYYRMISLDGGIRLNAYASALERHVHPASRVLDFGSGPGIFAALAARLGAKEVLALDKNPALFFAKKLFADNGIKDVQLFYGGLEKIPEEFRFDLIVADIHGALPYHQNALELYQSLQKRLAPGGKILPSTDRLFAAPAHVKDFYHDDAMAAFSDKYDIRLTALREPALQSVQKYRIGADELLEKGKCFSELNYQHPISTDFENTQTWVFDDESELNAFALWFDSEIDEGIQISNAPGETELAYGNVLLPLQKSYSIKRGNELELKLSAKYFDSDYIWNWSAHLDGHLLEKNSSFSSTLFRPEAFEVKNPEFRPEKNEKAELLEFALSRFDGKSSLTAICEEASQHFPDYDKKTLRQKLEGFARTFAVKGK